jgi:hypothetical protein
MHLGTCRTLIGVACLFISTSALADSHGQGADLDSRLAGSGHVFHGHVKSKHSENYQSPTGDKIIVTRYGVDVDESLKGDRSKQNEVVLEGGTVDGITLRVSDMPELSVGDEIVVFGDETKDGLFPHRRDLGILRVEQGTEKLHGESFTLRDIRDRAGKGK